MYNSTPSLSTLSILYMKFIIINIYSLLLYFNTVMVEQKKMNKYFGKESQYKIQNSQLFPHYKENYALQRKLRLI